MTNTLFLVALAAKLVWMDVDPAVLRGGNEPDDGLALLQAFHSSELELRGVSVVFGNSAVEVGYPNASEIGRALRPRRPTRLPGCREQYRARTGERRRPGRLRPCSAKRGLRFLLWVR